MYNNHANNPKIIKRDGRKVDFDSQKIIRAIEKAFKAKAVDYDQIILYKLSIDVIDRIKNSIENNSMIETLLIQDRQEVNQFEISVESIQDIVENVLIDNGYVDTAVAYKLYRKQRSDIREGRSTIMNAVAEIIQEGSRDNANVGNSPSAKLLQIAELSSKEYYLKRLIPTDQSKLHEEGYIHIHDLGWYGKTLTCLQIPLGRLLHDGFDNGKGYIRRPKGIKSAAALAAIIIQSNQNDMHGGQSFGYFDRDLATYVEAEYIKQEKVLKKILSHLFINSNDYSMNHIVNTIDHLVLEETQQAMEGFVYNLNTMHCLPSWEEFWTWDSKINELLLVTMEEFHNIFEENRYYAISLDKKTGISDFKLITHSFKKDNNRRLVKLKTNLGQTVTTTDNHLILSTDGRDIIDSYPEEINQVITPKEFELLYSDIRIPIAKYGSIQSNSPYLKSDVELTIELSELFGYYVADGSVIGDNSISFTVCHKIDFSHISDLMKKAFGVDFKKNEYDYVQNDRLSTKKEIRFSVGVRIARMFKDLAGYSSRTKKVPKQILLGIPNYQTIFLRAYFDCDGRRNSNYENAMSSSRLLISQINLMIKMLGECAYINTKSTTVSGFTSSQSYMYEISLGGLASVRAGIRESTEASFEIPKYDFSFYRNHIPFDKKHTLIPRRHSNAVRSSEIRIINDELNDESLRKFENIYPIPVASREIGNSEDDFVYDISVQDDENFLTRDGIFVHNSRAGAQVPFSSINLGTNTSRGGRLITKCFLKAYERGLGKGETPWWPNICFKVKDGVNFKPGDPNYDLFKLAMQVASKRLQPTFSFQDSSFNKQFIDEEVAYMGCRTRVISNVNGPSTTDGRGNLSFTTINLPRLGIEANRSLSKFSELLNNVVEATIQQLLTRYNIQKNLRVKDFPFLMGQRLYQNSQHLKENDPIEDAIKNGTLSVGFVGLAECLIALTSKHHGEDVSSQVIGIDIIKFMRDACDKATEKYGLNFTLLATPAESVAGRFLKSDLKKFGVIPGITDKEWYTNSFHVPVEHKIPAIDKIWIEGIYHKYCNAGHITYVELPSSPNHNIEAYEAIITAMKEADVGYGAVNFPVDTCKDCGFTQIIPNECPQCGSTNISRIRRITGYLSTLDMFNESKLAEVNHRETHTD